MKWSEFSKKKKDWDESKPWKFVLKKIKLVRLRGLNLNLDLTCLDWHEIYFVRDFAPQTDFDFEVLQT